MARITTHPIGDSNPADADLTTRIAIALSNHHRSGWRRIHVVVQQGAVTLFGEVSTFHNRQLVVAVTRHIAGVLRVADELTVNERRTRHKEQNAEFVSSNSNDGDPPPLPVKPHAFSHLPVLTESLEDILAAQPGSAAVDR